MDEIVGQLNYRGDIRAGMEPSVMWSDRHGTIRPVSVEYDEGRDLTTVGFCSLQREVERATEESIIPAEVANGSDEAYRAWRDAQ